MESDSLFVVSLPFQQLLDALPSNEDAHALELAKANGTLTDRLNLLASEFEPMLNTAVEVLNAIALVRGDNKELVVSIREDHDEEVTARIDPIGERLGTWPSRFTSSEDRKKSALISQDFLDLKLYTGNGRLQPL